MKISRRILLGGLAALPAAAGPGRAFSPSDAPLRVQRLIDAHKAAREALTAATLDADGWHTVREDASDAEWMAFQALRDHRPADMAEVAAKARYLLSTVDIDDEGDRMADNAVELLRSLVA
ncbi:hypothetical protein [Mesorhizobium sp. M0058]|uniref:hypothetical protein n=1 Tax=Mesorhizobium sp. M0058 TaxID=2956865 RepID=UPI00333CB22F